MFDSCFDVNSFVLREEIASRKSINEQANLALSPRHGRVVHVAVNTNKAHYSGYLNIK